MFDNALLDAVADVLGCERAELIALTSQAAATAPEQLLERAAASERLAAAAQASSCRYLASFADRRVSEDVMAGLSPDGRGRTIDVEVAQSFGVATMTAHSRVWEASRAVADHGQLLALVGTGRVAMSGLRKVLAATDVLDEDLRHIVDDQLVDEARRRRMTPGELARAAERRVLEADPDAAAKRCQRARRGRRVRLGDPLDGTAGIYATLRAEEALAVFNRLDRTARGMRQEGDERTLDDLMADLFVEHVIGRPAVPVATPDQSPVTWQSIDGWEPWSWSDAPPVLPPDDPEPDDPAWDEMPGQTSAALDPKGVADVGPPPRRPPIDVEVQVVLSMSTLLGLDDQPGMLRGYGAVPPSIVRDIVDTAEATNGRTMLRALFCDPIDGRLLTMDSKARFFEGGLRQFALYRDQHDRLTGGRISDIDHAIERRHGGPTTAHNGQALGRRSHVLKDHPRVSVEVLASPPVADGIDRYRAHAPVIRWTLPGGQRVDSIPPPALGDGSDPHDGRHVSAMEQHFMRLLAAA